MYIYDHSPTGGSLSPFSKHLDVSPTVLSDDGFYSPSHQEFFHFHPEDLYIVLQYMKDGNLANFMANARILREPIPHEIIRDIMCQILCGLHYMHSLKIIHRDLKPENLLLNDDNVVLADFGLSKKQQLEKGSSYICFRYYRPPEIVLNYHLQTTAIDVFSIGCIFFELLCIRHGIFSQKELFRVNGVLHHLQRFCEVLGYPENEDIKGTESSVQYFHQKINPKDYEDKTPYLRKICEQFDPLEADLVQRLLVWNPDKRISIKESLEYAYFSGCPYLTNMKDVDEGVDGNGIEVGDEEEDTTTKQKIIAEIKSFREGANR